LFLARDPLLRATAEPVLTMTSARNFPAKEYDAISSAVGDRLNEATLDKVCAMSVL